MTADLGPDGTVTGINVTPLVDIMLVLLVVFMVTAHFVQDATIKINLPKTAAADASATAALVVSVDRDGSLRLTDEMLDLAALKARLTPLAKADPGVRVTLAADQDISYKSVVSVLDAIKEAGVTRIALAAQR